MKTLLNHWKYLKFVLKHKWFVMIECFKYGLFWRGIIHDMNKFLPSLWFAYVNFSFSENYNRDETGFYDPMSSGDTKFINAYFYHVKNSKHHWQHWVLPDVNTNYVFPIPYKYLVEMLCDWRGASIVHGKGGWSGVKVWYAANKDKLILHSETRKYIEYFLTTK